MGVGSLICSPLLLLYFIWRPLSDERQVFRSFSELLSLLPGCCGRYLRLGFYRFTMSHCDSTCYIGFGTVFSTPRVSLGKNVYIGSHCSIGQAVIGDNTLLASGVRIISGLKQHGIASLEVPMREQEGMFQTITIGEDCWIGEAALVAATVEAHSVVAAASVVFEPVTAYSIMKGNPAIRIRDRRDKAQVVSENVVQ